MKVDLETLQRIAHLARLEFDPDQASAMLADMNRFLEFARVIESVPTEGVEPLVYLNEQGLAPREDGVFQTITHQEALANAPASDSDYFRVPKVVKKIN